MSTTQELVERLCDMSANFVEFSQTSNNDMHRRLYFNRAEVSRLAADRLSELERENARMRAALEPFAAIADRADNGWTSGNYYADNVKVSPAIPVLAFRAARAALAGSGEK
jgi:hypothetical protein